jgi:hypothetical protein
MSKHKTADEKLHSYRSDKTSLPRTAIRAANSPTGPIKRTNANNQFR